MFVSLLSPERAGPSAVRSFAFAFDVSSFGDAANQRPLPPERSFSDRVSERVLCASLCVRPWEAKTCEDKRVNRRVERWLTGPDPAKRV